MNKIKHSLIGLIIPVFALAVGCSSQTRTITYTQAREFVRKNYEDHVLDGASANYDITVESGLVDFDIKKIDSDGFEEDAKINFDLSNFATAIKDTYSLCVGTKVLDTVQRYYTSFSSLTLEFFTEIPLELKYLLSQGNELTIALTSGNAQNFALKTTSLLTNVFNVLSLLSRNDGAPINYDDAVNAGSPLAIVISVLEGKNEAMKLPILPMIANILGFIGYETTGAELAESMYEFLMLHDIGIDPKSQTVGDNFLIDGKTNNVGYLSQLDLVFTSTISSNVVIGNYEVSSYYDSSQSKTVYNYDPTTVDNYLIDGEINFNVNVGATFVS